VKRHQIISKSFLDEFIKLKPVWSEEDQIKTRHKKLKGLRERTKLHRPETWINLKSYFILENKVDRKMYEIK